MKISIISLISSLTLELYLNLLVYDRNIRYWICAIDDIDHSKIYSISTRAHVLSSAALTRKIHV